MATVEIIKTDSETGEVTKTTKPLKVVVIGTGGGVKKKVEEYKPIVMEQPKPEQKTNNIQTTTTKPTQQKEKRTFANWIVSKGVTGFVYRGNTAYPTTKTRVKGYTSEIIKDKQDIPIGIKFTKDGEQPKKVYNQPQPDIKNKRLPMTYSVLGSSYIDADTNTYTPATYQYIDNRLYSIKEFGVGINGTTKLGTQTNTGLFYEEKEKFNRKQFVETKTIISKATPEQSFAMEKERNRQEKGEFKPAFTFANIPYFVSKGSKETIAGVKWDIKQNPDVYGTLALPVVLGTSYVGGGVTGGVVNFLPRGVVNFVSKTKVAQFLGQKGVQNVLTGGIVSYSVGKPIYDDGFNRQSFVKAGYGGLLSYGSILSFGKGFTSGSNFIQKIRFGATRKEILSFPEQYTYKGKVKTVKRSILGYEPRQAEVTTIGGKAQVNTGKFSLTRFEITKPTSRIDVKYIGYDKKFIGQGIFSTRQQKISYTKTIGKKVYDVSFVKRPKSNLFDYSASLQTNKGSKQLFTGVTKLRQGIGSKEVSFLPEKTQELKRVSFEGGEEVIKGTKKTGMSSSEIVSIKGVQVLKAKNVGYFTKREVNLNTGKEAIQIEKGKVQFVSGKYENPKDAYLSNYDVRRAEIKPLYASTQTSKYKVGFVGVVGDKIGSRKTFGTKGIEKYQQWAKDWTQKNRPLKEETITTKAISIKTTPKKKTIGFTSPSGRNQRLLMQNQPQITGQEYYTQVPVKTKMLPIKDISVFRGSGVVGGSFGGLKQVSQSLFKIGLFKGTGTKQTPIQKPIFANSIFTGVKQSPITKQVPLIKQTPIQKPAQKQSYVSMFKQQVITKTPNVNQPVFTPVRFPNIRTPTPIIPTIPFGFNIPAGNGGRQNREFTKSRQKIQGKYTATLFGIALNKKATRKTGMFTGLEIRGI